MEFHLVQIKFCFAQIEIILKSDKILFNANIKLKQIY